MSKNRNGSRTVGISSVHYPRLGELARLRAFNKIRLSDHTGYPPVTGKNIWEHDPAIPAASLSYGRILTILGLKGAQGRKEKADLLRAVGGSSLNDLLSNSSTERESRIHILACMNAA